MAEITVAIAGRSYRLACPDGDEARAERLARLVSEKVAELNEAHGNIGVDRLLLMAAMMIADDLIELTEPSTVAPKLSATGS